jgi:sugar lactone lactonase YvrE
MNWQPAVEHRDGLGESPFWHPTERRLYWVDIPGRQLRRAALPGGAVESWAMPSEPGCIAPAQAGGLVVALRDGVYRARQWAGALEPVVRFNHDSATTRFNDGKADPVGRFWGGTLYEPKDANRGELYSVDCRPGNGQKGKPLAQLRALNNITSNGLAWSPDGRTLYWTHTARHEIHAWDFEPRAAVMRRHRVFARFEPKPPGWKPGDPGYGGRPDGAAVDVDGNYWVAMFEGGRLLQLSPSGECLAEVSVPVRCPTMPCFGGDDLRTLYVTSASQGRPADELAQLPLSGRVIAARADVAGLPVNFFID